MYHDHNNFNSETDDSDIDDGDRYLHLNDEVDNLYKSLNICNTVIYGGLDYLENKMLPLFTELDKTPDIKREINICAYNINISFQQPFIQYFLHKPLNATNDNKDVFIFPHFQYKNEQDVLQKSMTTIKVLCSSFYIDMQFDFKGYIVDDTNIFIFFDCSHMIIDTVIMTQSNDLWLVTIDEIINHQKVCNFNIHPSVVDLFHKYDKLAYLINEAGEHFVLPIIAYTNCPTKKLNFVSTFGTSTCPSGIFGNYFYFIDYLSAIRKVNNENEPNIGLLRCILFLGKMKIILNLKDDPDDQSNVVTHYLKTEQLCGDIRLKRRITDYNSNWALLHDSVFVGQVELDDGSILSNTPLWAVKKLNQYHILSSHLHTYTSL